jgi:predicted DNA-binding WGR domain protein
MKLIKQAKLFYQKDNSDKVYEVDICYVGGDRYVVDFRYGRRGASLKSGSKTPSPVVLAQAEKIFNNLVNEKLKEGYQHVGGAPAPVAAPVVSGAVSHENPFAAAVLKRLADKSPRNPWPINRAIWRAGELRLREAIPYMNSLFTANKDWLRDYCILWALGSIGDIGSYLTVKQYADSSSAQPQVKRIAKYAMLRCCDEATRAQLLLNFTRALPAQLAGLAESGPADRFEAELRSYLAPGHQDRYAVLEKLYLIDNEFVRPAVLSLLKEAPLKHNSYPPLRYIFKAAEFRRDAEVYGLLAYRFEKERANPGYYYSKNPFLNSTRDFFRRRQWHTIEHLGHLGDVDYVKMAVGLLLPYKDSDAGNGYNAQGYPQEWSQFSNYYAFNYILYGGSDRYCTPYDMSRKKLVSWGYKNYRDTTTPTTREEAFPHLWDKRPEGLLHLLVESECLHVHRFAVKAIQKHTKLHGELDLEVLIQLLAKPYEVTARFAFDIVWAKIKPLSPDKDLLAAIAECSYAEGRRSAHNLISQNAMLFLSEGAFLSKLITSKHADNRSFIRQFLKSTTITNEAEEQLIAKALSYVLSATPDKAIIESTARTLQECFIRRLQNLNREVVLDLLQHPSPDVQELGGNILLLQDRRPDEGELIHALLRSEFDAMRGIGIKLLGQLPEESLISQEGLLVSLCAHTLLSIRNMSRPLIKRLVSTHEPLKKRMAARLLELLLSKEPPSVHDHLISLLMDEFSSIIPTLSGELALRLTRAKSVPVQEFGGYLLSTYPSWGDELDTRDIAKLASHELRIVREACFAVFQHVLPRLRKSQVELGDACKLLEATWQDSRELGFRLFEETFTQDELTPQILVSICDSPRTDVRAFGQKMVTKYFQEAHGEEYLLKLSEHPSSDLQSFATNYLEQFARDNTERLKGLSHYFLSILSRVNKGRIAKQRVMQFLLQEAQKSEASAQFVVEIVNRVSATISIQDRARAIEMMVDLKRRYPSLPVLLQVQKTPEKQGAQHAV